MRVGDFRTRDEAVALSSRLQQQGLSGGWVAEEPRDPTPGRLKLLETGDEFSTASVVPAQPEDTLSADGMPYRGVLEVRPGEAGLTVVNVINLEDYLKGVVPNELSPDAFPQLEALKAQAVAARTYVAAQPRAATRHAGYDICATPSCQVYRGKSTEKALSDPGRGRDAGHHRLLPGRAHQRPLHLDLRRPHRDRLQHLRGRGRALPAWASPAPPSARPGPPSAPRPRRAALGDEPDLNRDAALLVSLDVLDPRRCTPRPRSSPPPTEEELRDWVGRLVAALQRKPCASAVEGPLTRRGTFLRHLVSALCWDERAQRLLTPGRSRVPAAASRTARS